MWVFFKIKGKGSVRSFNDVKSMVSRIWIWGETSLMMKEEWIRFIDILNGVQLNPSKDPWLWKLDLRCSFPTISSAQSWRQHAGNYSSPISCHFANRFWETHSAFSWYTAFPSVINSLLTCTLNGHPFLYTSSPGYFVYNLEEVQPLTSQR